MTRVLITGAAGFIGHHLVSYLLEKTDWELVLMDRLDTAGNLNRLSDVPQWQAGKGRVHFFFHDFRAPVNAFLAEKIGSVDYIFHLGAATHVDRSIVDPLSFVMDNVVGTAHMLEYARTLPALKLFMNFSTDEVFGTAAPGTIHTEDDPFRPSNPYSATKAGAASLGHAYFTTYGLPVVTTYTMNNFGERQHPEKLIPRAIRAALRGETIPIFAERADDGSLRPIGSRTWIHAYDTASAIHFLTGAARPGSSYNIAGDEELPNKEVVERVARLVGKPLLYEYVEAKVVRPGHDARYALDASKIARLGWRPEIGFSKGLERVVAFSVAHPEWI